MDRVEKIAPETRRSIEKVFFITSNTFPPSFIHTMINKAYCVIKIDSHSVASFANPCQRRKKWSKTFALSVCYNFFSFFIVQMTSVGHKTLLSVIFNFNIPHFFLFNRLYGVFFPTEMWSLSLWITQKYLKNVIEYEQLSKSLCFVSF